MKNLETIAGELFSALHKAHPYAGQYVYDNELEDIGVGAAEMIETSRLAMKDYDRLLELQKYYDKLQKYYDKIQKYYTGYVPALMRPHDLIEELADDKDKEAIFTAYLTWIGENRPANSKPDRP